MQLKKAILLLSISSSLFVLSSCGSGSGATTPTGSGSTEGSSLGIQSISTIDSLAGTTYTPTCMFSYGNVTTLVKGDGSGNGVSLNVRTGQVTPVNGLPAINYANGDICLANLAQLTWYNTSNTSTVNIYNPSTTLTTSVDLSVTGIAGSTITSSSFAWSASTNTLYANNNFLNNGYAGLSKFNLNESPITSFTNLSNTNYNRQIEAPVLYGFWGIDGSVIQMYPSNTATNQPAILVNMVAVGGGNSEQQIVQQIVDVNNQPITAMSNSWDMAFSGSGVIVATGALQPVIYNCPASSSIQYTKTCTKSYTSSAFTSQYRILRLLGANFSTLYFMGVDLAHGNINIFSMPL